SRSHTRPLACGIEGTDALDDASRTVRSPAEITHARLDVADSRGEDEPRGLFSARIPAGLERGLDAGEATNDGARCAQLLVTGNSASFAAHDVRPMALAVRYPSAARV